MLLLLKNIHYIPHVNNIIGIFPKILPGLMRGCCSGNTGVLEPSLSFDSYLLYFLCISHTLMKLTLLGIDISIGRGTCPGKTIVSGL